VIILVQAKCQRCLGSATGDSFEEASKKINHAVGLSRGIPCGNNYNRVFEIMPDKKQVTKVESKSKPTNIQTKEEIITPAETTTEKTSIVEKTTPQSSKAKKKFSFSK